MKQALEIVIEFSDKNLSAYIKEVDGITATAKDIKGIKKAIEEAISLYIENNKEMGMPIPTILEDEYEKGYVFDLCSFLNAYSKVFTKSALENITGINQKQLWHYASGKRKPNKKTTDRIANSIHELALELSKAKFN